MFLVPRCYYAHLKLQEHRKWCVTLGGAGLKALGYLWSKLDLINPGLHS